MGAKRAVVEYNWQGPQEWLRGYSDSDWVGCIRTGRSTSGGAVLLGTHWIRSWSTTQKVVALSSGEAELIVVVKMSTELLGLMNLVRDWQRSYGAKVFADSIVALEIVHRKGAGKLRHIRVSMLWVQDAREQGILNYEKIGAVVDPGDLMTKYISRTVMSGHMERLNIHLREGRADAGLELNHVTTATCHTQHARACSA